uniref:Uncharacterized protein n=1 Tax=Anguilla anguilla TaxID=7936 RepID=A0A0E9WZ36_ANGAN
MNAKPAVLYYVATVFLSKFVLFYFLFIFVLMFFFFFQVTTFSRLLTESDTGFLQDAASNIELLSLQQFDTEHSFLKKIRSVTDHTVSHVCDVIFGSFEPSTD